MVAVLGPLAPDLERYYIPIIEGFLYVFLIRSAVHVFQRGPGRLSRYASLPVAVMAAVLCLAVVVSAEKLSVPTESSGRICSQLLSPEERRAFERIPTGSGYTLLEINCPIGSFETSSRVMMSDLFLATRGDYFDIASGAERTANWLQKQGVDQLVYLDNDASNNFGLSFSRNNLELLKSESSESALVFRWLNSFHLESLEKFRKLAQYCESLRIPILDPQGPLVIVDVRQCKDRDSRAPAGANAHQ
jgi:hypothetical protein